MYRLFLAIEIPQEMHIGALIKSMDEIPLAKPLSHYFVTLESGGRKKIDTQRCTYCNILEVKSK